MAGFSNPCGQHSRFLGLHSGGEARFIPAIRVKLMWKPLWGRQPMKGIRMAKEAKPAGKKMDALMKPLMPQGPLAAIVGTDPLPRGQVVAKMWDYIRKHDLQKPTDKRVIVADDKLKLLFGKDECSMFEMNKFISAYLK